MAWLALQALLARMAVVLSACDFLWESDFQLVCDCLFGIRFMIGVRAPVGVRFPVGVRLPTGRWFPNGARLPVGVVGREPLGLLHCVGPGPSSGMLGRAN